MVDISGPHDLRRPSWPSARSSLLRNDLATHQVAGYLVDALGACVGRAEMVTTLRAIEAAPFTCGWVLGVPAAVLGKLDLLPTRTERGPAAWARLFAYAQPFRGAACALYAVQVPLSVQTSLRIEDVAPAGSTGELADGSCVTIESGARVFLVAQRQARLLRGADASRRLFVWEEDLEPMNVSTLKTAVEMPGAEVGFPLVSQIVATDHELVTLVDADALAALAWFRYVDRPPAVLARPPDIHGSFMGGGQGHQAPIGRAAGWSGVARGPVPDQQCLRLGRARNRLRVKSRRSSSATRGGSDGAGLLSRPEDA